MAFINGFGHRSKASKLEPQNTKDKRPAKDTSHELVGLNKRAFRLSKDDSHTLTIHKNSLVELFKVLDEELEKDSSENSISQIAQSLMYGKNGNQTIEEELEKLLPSNKDREAIISIFNELLQTNRKKDTWFSGAFADIDREPVTKTRNKINTLKEMCTSHSYKGATATHRNSNPNRPKSFFGNYFNPKSTNAHASRKRTTTKVTGNNYNKDAQAVLQISEPLQQHSSEISEIDDTLNLHANNIHNNDIQPALPTLKPLQEYYGKINLADKLKQYKTEDILLKPDKLKEAKFEKGGKYKQFDPGTGLLRGKSEKIKKELKKEEQLSIYIEKHPLKEPLKSCTSFQISLTPQEVKNAELPEEYHYAKVDIYDTQFVKSKELDEYLPTEGKRLSKEQIAGIGRQIMDALKFFYLAEIEHKDLHMHNILIHEFDGEILVKIIDYGKTTYANGHDFSDINYMFFKQAESSPQTFRRNIWRNPDSPEQQKHYPLHKLAQHAGIDTDTTSKFLYIMGKKLKSELQQAKTHKTNKK